MSILKPQYILTIIGTIALVLGSYVGWQLHQGRPLSNQYATKTPKSDQTPGSSGNTTGASTDSKSPSPAHPSLSFSAPSDSSADLSAQVSSSSVTPSTSEYKRLMTPTYQNTLQAMQTVKEKTAALQGKKLSIAMYRSSILEAQATFSAAEEFVRTNPPVEEKLNPSYRNFLAGIRSAKESMDIVLKGISTFSPSKLYAAREMGKQAQQQIIDGYSHF